MLKDNLIDIEPLVGTTESCRSDISELRRAVRILQIQVRTILKVMNSQMEEKYSVKKSDK